LRQLAGQIEPAAIRALPLPSAGSTRISPSMPGVRQAVPNADLPAPGLSIAGESRQKDLRSCNNGDFPE
jgi:hypothetical protein